MVHPMRGSHIAMRVGCIDVGSSRRGSKGSLSKLDQAPEGLFLGFQGSEQWQRGEHTLVDCFPRVSSRVRPGYLPPSQLPLLQPTAAVMSVKCPQRPSIYLVTAGQRTSQKAHPQTSDCRSLPRYLTRQHRLRCCDVTPLPGDSSSLSSTRLGLQTTWGFPRAHIIDQSTIKSP